MAGPNTSSELTFGLAEGSSTAIDGVPAAADGGQLPIVGAEGMPVQAVLEPDPARSSEAKESGAAHVVIPPRGRGRGRPRVVRDQPQEPTRRSARRQSQL